ncbi:uncharacterized protein IWZ02DRAFT_221732 [Phyllosticta citriasiana]|uniref:uncharacterized protein n=1 Tax=Phyllosticta citriasiana TaxID=595635 RepID=UPI0030FDE53D
MRAYQAQNAQNRANYAAMESQTQLIAKKEATPRFHPSPPKYRGVISVPLSNTKKPQLSPFLPSPPPRQARQGSLLSTSPCSSSSNNQQHARATPTNLTRLVPHSSSSSSNSNGNGNSAAKHSFLRRSQPFLNQVSMLSANQSCVIRRPAEPSSDARGTRSALTKSQCGSDDDCGKRCHEKIKMNTSNRVSYRKINSPTSPNSPSS